MAISAETGAKRNMMNAADLDPATRRKLLGDTKVPRLKPPNEGEALFKFQAKAMGLPAFEEQYEFAKSLQRRFAADFCWVSYKLLVEIQGGTWRKGGGAHSRPQKILSDMIRFQYAAKLGFFLLPFTPDEVYSGHAIQWTADTLRTRGWRGK